MSENKKWRCPYCDGLNDWQNEICEICGDGRREESIHETKRTEAPETPAAETGSTMEKPTSSPERDPDSSTRSTPAPGAHSTRSSLPDDTAPKTEIPPKKKASIWVPLVLILLVLGGGAFLLNTGLKETQPVGQSAGSGQESAWVFQKMENAPEIIQLTWNEEKKTVDITFRKNGWEGDFSWDFHYDRIKDKDQRGFAVGEGTQVASPEVVTVSTNNDYYIPGEWHTFFVYVEKWEGNICRYALSEPMEIQIPIRQNSNAKAVRQYDVSPLRAVELEKMEAAYHDGFDQYQEYKKTHAQQLIRADVDIGDRPVRVMISTPSGLKTVDTIYSSSSFENAVLHSFILFGSIEKGTYSVRFYDWENLCLADPDTFVFRVE